MAQELTDIQARLVNWMEQQKQWVVTPNDVALALGCSWKVAYSTCFGLVRKHWFAALGDDQHLLLRTSNKKEASFFDPLVVASFLARPYYLSFQTALRYHGLVAPDPLSAVYVVTTRNRNSVTIQNVFYRVACVLPRKFFGFHPVDVHGHEIFMADKEKAVVESFEKPRFAGGIAQVIRMMAGAGGSLDVSRMIEYAVQMKIIVLLQRLGYVLDRLGVCFDDDYLLQYVHQSLSYLDPSFSFDIKSHRNVKWNIMVNVPDSVFCTR